MVIRSELHEQVHARALAVCYVLHAASLPFVLAVGWTSVLSPWLQFPGVADVGSIVRLRHAAILVLGGAAVVLVVLALLAAVAIWRRSRWSRAVALAAACTSLPIVPFGTAIAVLTFWLAFAPPPMTVEEKRVRTVADTFR